jgi:hypothetical protein
VQWRGSSCPMYCTCPADSLVTAGADCRRAKCSSRYSRAVGAGGMELCSEGVVQLLLPLALLTDSNRRTHLLSMSSSSFLRRCGMC